MQLYQIHVKCKKCGNQIASINANNPDDALNKRSIAEQGSALNIDKCICGNTTFSIGIFDIIENRYVTPAELLKLPGNKNSSHESTITA